MLFNVCNIIHNWICGSALLGWKNLSNVESKKKSSCTFFYGSPVCGFIWILDNGKDGHQLTHTDTTNWSQSKYISNAFFSSDRCCYREWNEKRNTLAIWIKCIARMRLILNLNTTWNIFWCQVLTVHWLFHVCGFELGNHGKSQRKLLILILWIV